MKSKYLLFLITFLFSGSSFAQTITTAIGAGTAGFSGDGAQAVFARISKPSGVAVDANHNIYIADAGNFRIRKINAAGVVTTFAGSGLAGNNGNGGPATAARIGGTSPATSGIIAPMGIATDQLGNVYIADGANNVVRKVDIAGVITTIAGTGTAGYSGNGGPATAATLRYPQGLFVDRNRNLYIADRLNNSIRKIDTFGIITTIAGTGSTTGGFTGNGGPATAATLNAPYDVTVDTSGNAYISDYNNNCIRKVSSGIINILAGTGTAGYTGDGGAATAATLNHPVGVRFDVNGNLYVADNNNSCVRMIDTAAIIKTFAGTGVSGYSGDNGPATAAKMMAPWGIAFDADAFMYVSDYTNARVRRVALIQPISGASTICIGSATTLINGATGGSWTSSADTIARIDTNSGVVTGLQAGATVISYTTAAGIATFQLTVKGSRLTSADSIATICSDNMVMYTATADSTGAAITWTRAYVPGVGNLAASGTGDVMEILSNISSTTKTVVYVYRVSFDGCTTVTNVTVRIRTAPRLSSTKTPAAICDSELFSYFPTSFSSGVTFAWSRSATPGISNPAASGIGDIMELLNSTVSVPVNVKYVYTMTGGGPAGCTFTDTVTATVNPCRPAAIGAFAGNGSAIELYPNPASGYFSISRGAAITGDMSVRVYDIAGRPLQLQTTEKSAIDISVAGYAPGVYYCEIIANGAKTVKKLVVN